MAREAQGLNAHSQMLLFRSQVRDLLSLASQLLCSSFFKVAGLEGEIRQVTRHVCDLLPAAIVHLLPAAAPMPDRLSDKDVHIHVGYMNKLLLMQPILGSPGSTRASDNDSLM